MQMKFVEIRPLLSWLFFKTSSNFQKMFRSVLSEKIMIFLKNVRAKFEVETFQGNQTKMQDMKLEAANCYMTWTRS